MGVEMYACSYFTDGSATVFLYNYLICKFLYNYKVNILSDNQLPIRKQYRIFRLLY
ncbi:hypothetical protein T07_5184 [Trichinella nelsoni]|uniref:Uncharacterized protein n=1 Tax=Trichinella nelsoni TaxID=6336 RepID=A0A0V0RBU8_9BILA|nr:hypothetical protein T07_5184 [Trichinella nelsoni]